MQAPASTSSPAALVAPRVHPWARLWPCSRRGRIAVEALVLATVSAPMFIQLGRLPFYRHAAIPCGVPQRGS
jgi:hypothetical protein